MAKVDKDLRRTKHEIFALGHNIEESRREDHKTNESNTYAMKENKYELLDEEMALKMRKDDLKMTPIRVDKKGGRKRHHDTADDEQNLYSAVQPSTSEVNVAAPWQPEGVAEKRSSSYLIAPRLHPQFI
uniref:Zinc finger, CCHC-type n=1 Tax=Haemonchus contortus TaxID=6289 RepID=A0A7I4XWZ5_HAECO